MTSERFIEIGFERRDVWCVARLLDDEAPHTASIVWNALPQYGGPYHAKYARNEVYILVPRFVEEPDGVENPTLTPIAGDVCYFSFAPGELPIAQRMGAAGIVDLAVFYDRNNLLLSPDTGFVTATVFGTIVDNLNGIADACNDIWRAGAADEVMVFRRGDGS